jgi:beta-lactamase class A
MRISAVFAYLAIWVCIPAMSQTAPPAPPDLPATDPKLATALDEVLRGLGLENLLAERRLAVALLDISDPQHPRYAGFNDRHMMYAASLPKIAIILAGFEAVRSGILQYTPALKQMFTNTIRFSSNTDASRVIRAVGFDYIARVLTSPIYRLYDPRLNGGLWIGKAYGGEGPSEYWKRDPLANLSHAATALQVARFFWLMDQGRLVSPEFSAEMKEIFSKPGIHHKFVKGLEAMGVRSIYRKSGTWKDAHCDAALVEHAGKRYIAVALMKDERGGEVLPKLIQRMHAVVTARPQLSSSAPGLDHSLD